MSDRPPNMDRIMAQISRLLNEREFESEEEMRAFMEKNVIGRNADDLADLLEETDRSPLDRAQDRVYDAWEAGSRRESIRLAREALEISPDCADAYSLLAEEQAETAAEARALYEQAVAAGERALGPQPFEEGVGHFWGIHTTRPYMRARAGLAEALWELGERDAAIGHLWELLRLSENDNLGIRYVLLPRLLEVGDDDGADELLDRYDEASAAWLYNRALLLFRARGEGEEADAALAEAVEENPHVPPYLTGKKKAPAWPPEAYAVGSVEEARAYVYESGDAWRATDGARGWLVRRAGG